MHYRFKAINRVWRKVVFVGNLALSVRGVSAFYLRPSRLFFSLSTARAISFAKLSASVEAEWSALRRAYDSRARDVNYPRRNLKKLSRNVFCQIASCAKGGDIEISLSRGFRWKWMFGSFDREIDFCSEFRNLNIGL